MIRPLLKWAGGKRQLLPVLRRFYPLGFTRYIEPFFGSGAVFFDLCALGRLRDRPAWLLDDNLDLMGCYLALRRDPDAVIDALARLEAGHRLRGDVHFYEVRDERFNRARQALLAHRDAACYTPELAAMLIYLNRTGYNGLFRVNARGLYNVPAGRYDNPRIVDPVHLRAVVGALGATGVRLTHGSFEEALADARADDFVYCDPPYAPISRTARFSHYTAGGFTALDQRRLHRAGVDAARRGAIVVVSNSSAPEIEAAYTDAPARRAGLTVYRVAARRAINSSPARRGPVDELIISNAPPVPTSLSAPSAAPPLRMLSIRHPRPRRKTA